MHSLVWWGLPGGYQTLSSGRRSEGVPPWKLCTPRALCVFLEARTPFHSHLIGQNGVTQPFFNIYTHEKGSPPQILSSSTIHLALFTHFTYHPNTQPFFSRSSLASACISCIGRWGLYHDCHLPPGKPLIKHILGKNEWVSEMNE